MERWMNHIFVTSAALPPGEEADFFLVLFYDNELKMEEIHSSKISVDFQQTARSFTPE
jgi:hypothetical protein